MSVLMADSTRPWTIPNSVNYALVYSNGAYTWPDDQIDRFTGHAFIGVHPGDPGQARQARELDVERYGANPQDAAPFVHQRLALGHHDGTIYCNRSTVPAVADLVKQSGYPLHLFRWHIATLDGTRTVDVPFGVLWAVQFETVANAYDLSIVYGPLDFSRG